MKMKRSWYQFLQWQDYLLGVWSCKAMQLRGFASRPLHPKHLFDEHRSDFLGEYLQPQIVFLDLGSGVGTDCIRAARMGAITSIGLEKNRGSIITAVQQAQLQGVKPQFIEYDFESGVLPFVDNSFDVINFSNVLEHIIERRKILYEVKRVKKPEGRAIISVPNSETTWKQRLRSAGLDSRDDPDHKIEYSRSSLSGELQSAGLSLASKLIPIIPSFPWNGLIAMSAAVSPKIYVKLQQKKRDYVKRNPDESIGWVFSVK